METTPLISVNGLQVNIAGKVILDNVDLVVHPGKVVTIIGPNGAGKSTLIRAILGLIKPISSGKIYLQPGLRIGYMPQKLMIESLMPITVDRFLRLNLRNKAPIDHENNYLAILAELKVAHLANTPLQMVSGGELQRILLARALLNAPQLLVLDEPVQGVDVTGQAELYKLINAISVKYHCGILMVSHDLHLVMASTNEVICLNKHICCSGHPEAVSMHPEFLDLFGTQISAQLAFYTHHHNHKHNLKGEVMDELTAAKAAGLLEPRVDQPKD